MMLQFEVLPFYWAGKRLLTVVDTSRYDFALGFRRVVAHLSH